MLTPIVAGKSERARRKRALATYASMIGALVLARAVDDPDLSEEVLQSVLASVAQTDAPV
jgi:TetR/AcrR family transcriptional repressor of nem operon